MLHCRELNVCPKLSSTNQVLDWDHLRMLCRLQKCIACEFLGRHHYLATVSRYKGMAIKGIFLCVPSNDSYKCACFLLSAPWAHKFWFSPGQHISCIPTSNADDICNCPSVLDRIISSQTSDDICCNCMFLHHLDCILHCDNFCRLASYCYVAFCPFLPSTIISCRTVLGICHSGAWFGTPALWDGFRLI